MIVVARRNLIAGVLFGVALSALMCIGLTGCDEVRAVTGSTWHEKVGWKAEDYFTDPQAIAMCHAIEANDLKEMDRLIATGADVNAKGKDGMTLLLWAFPDNKLERFTKLLEHGADPNVIFEGGDPKDIMQGTFNSHGAFLPGDSVTILACQTGFPGYFETVFSHGGDPNVVRTGRLGLKDTPLFTVIKFSKRDHKAMVQTLLDKGADINYRNQTGITPVMEAVVAFGQYDLALMLLQARADYNIYKPRSNERLIHIVAGQEHRLGTTPQQNADYQTLIQWLEDHGESLDAAKTDLKRWQSYGIGTAQEYRRKIDAEIAEREAKEAAEKKAAGQSPDPKK